MPLPESSPLDTAPPEMLARILREPDPDQERLLRLWYGEDGFFRLRTLAQTETRSQPPRRGHVVVLPGILGSALSLRTGPPPAAPRRIWVHPFRLIDGELGSLRMGPDLQSEHAIEPDGVLNRWYAGLILGLRARDWNVHVFAYDWRQDLAVLADQLHAHILACAGSDAPVHLVAHSMGGLVSRTYIQRHPERWARGGRLVMLGTPNHGSFAIPQLITGALPTIRMLDLLDVTRDRRQLCALLNTLPGAIQMLPSPFRLPDAARFYDLDTWGPASGLTPRILDAARASHERLHRVADGTRMAYVAGCNQATKSGVANWNHLDHPDGYADSPDGDGTVPHGLGFLEEPDGSRIPTFFVEAKHGALPNDPRVIAAADALLESGTCSLPASPPRSRSLADLPADLRASDLRTETHLREAATLAETLAATRDAAPISDWRTQRAEEILLTGFLDPADDSPPVPGPAASTTPPPSLTVRLVHGQIEDLDDLAPDADAISIGTYSHVLPQNALAALDAAISPDDDVTSDSRILRSLIRRGMIEGRLGQPFVLPDPRRPERLIVVAGMGQPGEFREAELTVLAHGLVWMLDRLGKTHLATVLIGAGTGNLDGPAALHAWLRGARRALQEIRRARPEAPPVFRTLTFVEFFAAQFVRLDAALRDAAPAFASGPKPLRIEYQGPDPARLAAVTAKAEQIAANMAKKAFRDSLAVPSPAATGSDPGDAIRLTVRLTASTYEFAALTRDAAIPKRDITLDPSLVEEVSAALASRPGPADQAELGHLLGHLLLPREIQNTLERAATPVVATVDRSTARIPWEMITLRPRLLPGQDPDAPDPSGPGSALGLRHGLTRQFLTSFAPLPDLPILSRSVLRVLVVADPAADAPLPGAREEGRAVVACFERFRPIAEAAGLRLEIVSLIGPGEATRSELLRRLIHQRFDLLHFAGHAIYDPEDPARSGWQFGDGTKLSAHELNRVDRIPPFVFSNACSSGVTPGHTQPALVPSFAEAFFARGVRNFVATAWPVDDRAAVTFATSLYEALLGLEPPAAPPMHHAMARARLRTATEPGGQTTWGAYQHYGDPDFRFLAPPPKQSPSKPRKRPRRRRG